jgi:hypothetical protein
VSVDATWQFPGLFQILGGYLHQDFDLEFASPDEALRAASLEASEQIERALAEIDTLLKSGLAHRELERIVERLTSGYARELDGWDARAWLTHARAILGGAA